MVPIVNETIDSRLRNRRKEVVYKLYIEKPYDHVNCTFLLEMISGFWEKNGLIGFSFAFQQEGS